MRTSVTSTRPSFLSPASTVYIHTQAYTYQHVNSISSVSKSPACACMQACHRHAVSSFLPSITWIYPLVATCTYTCVHTHMYTCTHTYIHMHKHLCARAHTQTHIHAYIQTVATWILKSPEWFGCDPVTATQFIFNLLSLGLVTCWFTGVAPYCKSLTCLLCYMWNMLVKFWSTGVIQHDNNENIHVRDMASLLLSVVQLRQIFTQTHLLHNCVHEPERESVCAHSKLCEPSVFNSYNFLTYLTP